MSRFDDTPNVQWTPDTRSPPVTARKQNVRACCVGNGADGSLVALVAVTHSIESIWSTMWTVESRLTLSLVRMVIVASTAVAPAVRLSVSHAGRPDELRFPADT